MENKTSLVYGIADYTKGKVEHVGGLTKVTTTQGIAADKLLPKARTYVNVTLSNNPGTRSCALKCQ